MGSSGSAAKRYIGSVSDALSCSGKTKKRIISQIRDGVEDYLLQNPDADCEMIQTHFGTPQEIAASYVNEQDACQLLKKMSIKKKGARDCGRSDGIDFSDVDRVCCLGNKPCAKGNGRKYCLRGRDELIL